MNKSSIFQVPFSIDLLFNNVKIKWKMPNGKLQIPKGFTLVELIVVIGIIAILTSFGIASFASYNNRHTLEMAVADVSTMITTARSRSLSQVKPSQCAAQVLSGYQVVIDVLSGEYTLRVLCGNAYTLETKKIPEDITFGSDATTTIFFPVLTGDLSESSRVPLSGSGVTKVIEVDVNGTVMVK